MTAQITIAKTGAYVWMVSTPTTAAAHPSGQVRTVESTSLWAGHFTGMKCRISGLLSPYNSSCKWLDVVHICTLFCSLGDRCQWILQKIVYIKATTKRGNFPLHCSALQPYMHVIFTDKSCGSWAAMQCDSELHFCLYGLAWKRVYISQKYKAWLFYYNCVLLWCFDTFGGIFDVG